MESAETERWITPFKQFDMVRVNISQCDGLLASIVKISKGIKSINIFVKTT